jgi:[protein-PII] uridylyltransferase
MKVRHMGVEAPAKAKAPKGGGFSAAKLTRALAALAEGAAGDNPALRKSALATVKSAFAEARNDIRCRFEAGEATGIETGCALSALQDDIIRVLYEFASQRVYPAANPTAAEHLALVATGGYGRGPLAPHSDIDLLFLRPYKQTAWGESVIEFVLHTLWDLGLKVGHATRSVADCVRLAKDDISIRTALLEARHITGEKPLSNELKKKFWSEVAASTGREFVEAKLAERDGRHRRQGESRYLIEPNIKEGKGGLRDLQTLYWIGKYLYRVEHARDLIKKGVFTTAEFEIFEKAEALFWQVRVHLHYLAERAEDRLSFDVQPDMARRLGHDDASTKRAVEEFMRSYFLAAKDVGDLTRIFCAALEAENKKPRPGLASLLPGFLKPRSGGEDFFVENGRLRAREGLFAEAPANLIRLFQIADEKRVDVHPETLRTVTRSLDLIDDTVRNDPAVNRMFLDILSSRHDPERALRRMNEAGVLGRFMPEFGRTVALVQFNMYHHYTVDEHLLYAVGNMARIERGEVGDEHPLASELIKRVKSREALYLAMLTHDIAKGLHGDHSVVGAAIARPLAERLGLSEPDVADVVWLVLHHLTMSDMAQRRDISDPKTVQDFVQHVQTPERLRLLLLLTVADIRSVGPGVWNGWKGQLLRDLYYEADALMSGGDPGAARGMRIFAAKADLEARIHDFPPDARERALTRHSDSYWLTFDVDTLERHARMMRAADSQISSPVHGGGGSPRSGETEGGGPRTDPSGAPPAASPASPLRAPARLGTSPVNGGGNKASGSEAVGQQKTASSSEAVGQQKTASSSEAIGQPKDILAVEAINDSFQSVSEIVIYTPDTPGLFSRLTGTFAVSRGSIVDAKIFTTTDGYALDVFRVQDADGAPFGDEARIERLRRAIARTARNDAPLRAALARRPPKRRVRAFNVRPRVHLDNEASNASTVIEIIAPDRPGLLYDVTNALFGAGLSISSAVIATYGERAVDVFYVRDAFGHKLTHPERIKAVEEEITRALGATTE